LLAAAEHFPLAAFRFLVIARRPLADVAISRYQLSTCITFMDMITGDFHVASPLAMTVVFDGFRY